MPPISNVFNRDCMEAMREFPDKFFELAIVDPPYGIQVNMNAGRKANTKSKKRALKNWDNETPPKKYWDELFRVSFNQIVFGGNYMANFLPPKMGVDFLG